jgi:ppGpp synthetase/RelA/SpoT-type nucleotidyltranferase
MEKFNANEENRDMVKNNTVQIKHHALELEKAVKAAKDIPAWIVAKVYEATTALSNATHYLDGTTKMAVGGRVFTNSDFTRLYPSTEYLRNSKDGKVVFKQRKNPNKSFVYIEKGRGQYRQEIAKKHEWRMAEGGGVEEKKYRILSPDGFDIEMDRVYSKSEVMPAFEKFKQRFEKQGYYSTSSREQIPLDDLADYMDVIEVDEDEDENENYGHGGKLKSKTGTINDPKSFYNGMNCFILSEDDGEYKVSVMVKGKSKIISIDKDKFSPVKTYADGGKVSIVNENVKFDESKYKGIFGDYDKDGVVNIDDAYPTNKKRKNTVEQIELAPIIEKLISLKNKLDSAMYSTVDELKAKSPKSANIYARTKTPYSIVKKLIDKRLLDAKKGLTDLIGTTIAVDTYDQLVELKNKIEDGLLGEVVSVDDFYTHPNAGYMAYHYIIKTPEGFLVEVQLKTKRMKSLNEISHEFYKKGNLDAENFLQLTKLTHLADMGDKYYLQKYDYLMKRKSLLRMLLSGEKRIDLKSERLIKE